jgi:DNA replication protein DnaC
MSWQDAVKKYRIQREYHDASLANAKLIPPSIIQQGLDWLKEPPRCSLFLHGNAGSGKTYYMTALLRGLLEKIRSPQTVVVYDKSVYIDKNLHRASMGEYQSENGWSISEESLLRTYSEVSYLFIDDLGVECDSERVRRQYTTFLDERFSNHLPTICTSNLTPEELGKTLGDRVASRMNLAKRIEFPPHDHRKHLNRGRMS